jgi:hypothetical protein
MLSKARRIIKQFIFLLALIIYLKPSLFGYASKLEKIIDLCF